MSIRYRLKRNSVSVHEPIPAHPDSIYRPENRPIPIKVSPVDSAVAAPRLLANNPMMAAPLAASGDGFSPWWIIGPLLALLAAMAVGALAYSIKKKQNLKKQDEEENSLEKRSILNTKTSRNKDDSPDVSDNNGRNSPFENIPLKTVKSNAELKEQKRTLPVSSSAKDNLTSDTNPLLSTDLSKSPLLGHDLPLTSDSSAIPFARPDSTSSVSHLPPVNMTEMRKPISNASKHTDVATHRTKSSSSQNLPLSSTNSFTASTISTKQKFDQSLFGENSTNFGHVKHTRSLKSGHSNSLLSHSETNRLDADKKSSNTNLNEKEKQLNDLQKAHNSRYTALNKSVTDFDRMDHPKTGQSNTKLSSSSSQDKWNDRNAADKSDHDYINDLNSPEQHGIGKSPLISSIPTGSKRPRKGKSQSQTDQREENELSSKSSLSNPDLDLQSSSKENTQLNKSENPSSISNVNKEKQLLAFRVDSKHHSSSKSKVKTSSSSINSAEPLNDQSSDPHSMFNKNDSDKFDSRHMRSFTKGLDANPSDGHLQSHTDTFNLHGDKSDESNTSLKQANITNHNKTSLFMPNVPQCKTNTSSDDEDYDEIYPISTRDSSLQSNSNKNASTYQKSKHYP